METVLKDTPILQQAHEQYQKFTASDELRAIYEARLKRERDHNTLLDSARKEGIEEGRLKEKQLIACSLIGSLQDEVIAEKIGLSLEEIEELKRNRQ